MEPPSTTPAIRVREDSPAWAATAGLPLDVNVLDYLIEAVMILDSEQRILFWSAAAERIYGVAPSAAHGRPWAAVVQPRWPEPTAEAAADQALEQSGSWRGELIHQRCDGGAFPAEVRITILKTAAGAPAGRLVVVRDVSGRTRARRRLSDREEQLREVQRLARLGSWEWDVAQDKITWSDELYRIYGLKPAEFPATYAAFLARSHPADRDRTDAEVQQALREKRSFHFEHRIVRPDGVVRTLQSRGAITRDATGRVVGLFGTCQDITEVKQAQEALGESQALLQAIVENSESSIYVKDRSGRYRLFNRRCGELLQMTPAQALGRTDHDLLPAPVADQLCANDQRVLTTGQPMVAEEHLVLPDGRQLTNLSVKFPLCDASGAPWAICGISTDITDRKRIEEALRDSEERHRLMSETIPLPSWRCNAAGEVIDCNRHWYAYTGQTPAAAAGTGWMRAVHPDDLALVVERCQSVVATGGVFEVEYRLRRHDGVYRWHLARGLPVRDETGRVTSWFGCAADIDDRKRAEEGLLQVSAQLEAMVQDRTAELEQANVALRESEERFRGAFMNAMTGVALVAVDGRFLQVNPALCDMAGYSAPELLQKTFRDLVHPDDLAAALALMRCLLTGELSTTTVEHRYLHKRGQVIWTHVNASLVRDRRGQPLYFVAQVQDVTERRQLEQAVLEARERERQQLAADLHDSLGQQLTGIAFLSKALQERLAVRAPAAAREAARIAKLTGAAIADTRELARHFDATAVETAGLVAALRTLATTTAGVFRIACLFKCPQPVVVTDSELAGQLYRIAQEAVSNAVRHARARHIVIRLTQHASELRLTITDDGRGFSPARVTSKGMGLRNMRQRARSIGGTLEIASRRGAGTTVRCCWKSPLTA